MIALLGARKTCFAILHGGKLSVVPMPIMQSLQTVKQDNQQSRYAWVELALCRGLRTLDTHRLPCFLVCPCTFICAKGSMHSAGMIHPLCNALCTLFWCDETTRFWLALSFGTHSLMTKLRLCGIEGLRKRWIASRGTRMSSCWSL